MANCYRTTPTDGLFLLLQITPIDIVVRNAAKKSLFLHTGANSFTQDNGLLYGLLDKPIKYAEVQPALRSFSFANNLIDTPLSIYTDGSKIENEVGFAFCVFEENSPLFASKFRLQSYNSVFQAEVAAISEAVKWLVKNNMSQANIFSDSLSAIYALQSYKNKSTFLHEIKAFLQQHHQLFALNWVRAHVGIAENEHVDQLAKAATKDGSPFAAPQPRSFLKATLKLNLNTDWSTYWQTSSLHQRFRRFYPAVNPSSQPIFSSSLASFISGHGPFPAYLHRFHLRQNPYCPCGEVGEPEHYLTSCSRTSEFHLDSVSQSLLISDPPGWLQLVLEDDQQRNSIQRCYSTLQEMMK